MKVEDLKVVSQIIESEENISDLIKVREMLTEQMQKISMVENKEILTNEEFEMSKNILLKNFIQFMKENTKFYDKLIVLAAEYISKILDIDIFDLKVFYFFNPISNNKLETDLKFSYMVEKCLNKYGLSLNRRLTLKQFEELEAISIEKENKKTLS